MLTMRPQKTVVFSLVATEKAYDILDDGRPVAVVSYLKNKGGKVTIDGQSYPIVRSGGPSDEMLGQALIRAVTGRKRVPASWTLTDAAGKTLAAAEHSKDGFAVRCGEEKFTFRKVEKKGPYNLFRDGNEQSLGSTQGMNLMPEFGLPFQAFLFSLQVALVEEELGGADGGPVTVN